MHSLNALPGIRQGVCIEMADSAKRNVLFIIADDWSPIAKCYGNDVIQTPHIDRLAQRGTTFDHAYCSSPSCAVSRACIFTGQHAHQHGQYGHCHGVHTFRTMDKCMSLPRLLQKHGIASALIGKKHTAPQSVYPFDLETPSNMGNQKVMRKDAAAFLDQIGDKPFYLHMGSSNPHRSGDPSGFNNTHNPEGYEPVVYDPADVVVPDFLPDIPETREELAEYYQAISRYDALVGEMLELLEERGKLDDTLVVVTTDHAMPWPGGKASSFDTGHRCPLIIAAPGQQKQGIHSQAMFSWVDFCPTLMDWYGIDASEHPEAFGKSVLPVLEEEEPDGWDHVYFSHCFHEVTNYYPYRVLREPRYKFVQNLASELRTPLPTDLYRSKTWQAILRDDIEMMGKRPTQHFLHQPKEALYDLEADPVEAVNLIDKPEHAERVKRMRDQVVQFRYDTKDPWIELSWQHGEVPEGMP